jgi:hypothetical protein
LFSLNVGRGFVRITPASSCNEWPQREVLPLNIVALQFGFNRVKDNLGWHHCNASPEDDRGARSN